METMAKPVDTIITVTGKNAEKFVKGKMDSSTKQRILLKASKVKRHTTFSGRR